ncbi:cupredoxin domain-containing protein [Aquibacillus rhizosphaerae]|uniref:Cytochrome C oxidase subunit II n=1 Tax=Aquibacillus rhizosphaerae TaxID=3051431 RepID=A0ABT7L2G8_9BACI|nr:cytochrome C oxidase subunit II [Aquibacillus sp. LR5S19]MDL4839599.1 cytochrome C oxidase subunit II [Aquibacillus sp. LR5S19]
MNKIIVTVLFSSLILFLAACGGDESANEGNSDSSSGNTVDLVASNWEFEQDTYKTTAGDITFNLKNDEGFHGIEIEGTDLNIEGEGSATTSLKAGEYTIRCTVPCGEGHEEMTATLIVE